MNFSNASLYVKIITTNDRDQDHDNGYKKDKKKRPGLTGTLISLKITRVTLLFREFHLVALPALIFL
jgi:hypothetical protein